MTWNARQYGSKSDPIHQSDVDQVTGSYGCPRKFAFYKDYADAHGARYESKSAYGKRELGTAVHDTIAEYLTKAGTRICAGKLPRIRVVLEQLTGHFDKVVDGRPVVWGKNEREQDELNAGAHMVLGALRGISERAEKILFAEAPFLAPIETPGGKTYWIEGTIDVAYRHRNGTTVLDDWKTGARKHSQHILDRGFQLGLYSYALEEGVFWPGTRDVTYGVYPDAMHIVHLRDFAPYKKKGKKRASNALEAVFYGLDPSDRKTVINFERGDLRGPGWYPSRRKAGDHHDLLESLRAFVGTIRFRRWWKSIGEACDKCPFYDACSSEGFRPDVEEAALLEKQLRGIDVPDFDAA